MGNMLVEFVSTRIKSAFLFFLNPILLVIPITSALPIVAIRTISQAEKTEQSAMSWLISSHIDSIFLQACRIQ